MFKKILKLKIVIVLVLASTILGFVQPVFAQTAAGSEACGGLTAVDPNACAHPTKSGTTLGNILNTVINILSLLIGAVAVIMILVAGFRFITSGGGEGVKAAKNTLIYALIGIAVAVLGQVMVHFVLNRLDHKAGTSSYLYNSITKNLG